MFGNFHILSSITFFGGSLSLSMRGPKDQTNLRLLNSGPSSKAKGNVVCRMLMSIEHMSYTLCYTYYLYRILNTILGFSGPMWSLGPLHDAIIELGLLLVAGRF